MAIKARGVADGVRRLAGRMAKAYRYQEPELSGKLAPVGSRRTRQAAGGRRLRCNHRVWRHYIAAPAFKGKEASGSPWLVVSPRNAPHRTGLACSLEQIAR